MFVLFQYLNKLVLQKVFTRIYGGTGPCSGAMLWIFLGLVCEAMTKLQEELGKGCDLMTLGI